MLTETKRKPPLTIYGMLAEKHSTSREYVERIVNGRRRPERGIGYEILQDWNQIESNYHQWILNYKPDQAIVVTMDDIKVSVFIQHGISSIYKNNELVREEHLDEKTITIRELESYLNIVRIEFK